MDNRDGCRESQGTSYCQRKLMTMMMMRRAYSTPDSLYTRVDWKVHMMSAYLYLTLWPMGSKHSNTDGKKVLGTLQKNKPKLITLLVNFSPRLLYKYIYIQTFLVLIQWDFFCIYIYIYIYNPKVPLPLLVISRVTTIFFSWKFKILDFKPPLF